MSSLFPRDPVTEWVQHAATGTATPAHLEWVDATLDAPSDARFDGTRFSHAEWHQHLPPALVQAAIEAQADGLPTLLEGVLYLMAWLDWSVQGRDLLWSPLGWQPELLAQLAEAYGVDPGVHRGQPERLSRLAARLGRWFPLRGHLDRSLELLQEVTGDPLPGRYEDHHSVDPALLRDEVLACHDDAWWRQRGAGHALRISEGWVRFQPEQPACSLSPEDVLVVLDPGTAPDPALVRLLPAGACLRIVPKESA